MSRYTGHPSQRSLIPENVQAQYSTYQISLPRGNPASVTMSLNEQRPRLYDQDAPNLKKTEQSKSFYMQDTWSTAAVAGDSPRDDLAGTKSAPRSVKSHAHTSDKHSRHGKQGSSSTISRPDLSQLSRSKSDSASSAKKVRFALPVDELKRTEPKSTSARHSTRPASERSQTTPPKVESAVSEPDWEDPVSLKDWIYQTESYTRASSTSSKKSSASSYDARAQRAVSVPPPEFVSDPVTLPLRPVAGRSRPSSVSSQSNYSHAVQPPFAERSKAYVRGPPPSSPLARPPMTYEWTERGDDAAWRVWMKTDGAGDADTVLIRRSGDMRPYDRRYSAF